MRLALPSSLVLELTIDPRNRCNLWAIHHDEEYFPEPDKFDPERYMTGPATAYPQKHGHSAFGWGESSFVYSFEQLKLTLLSLQAVESAQVGPQLASALLGSALTDPILHLTGQHVAERGVFIVILHLLHHFILSTPKGSPAPDIFAFTVRLPRSLALSTDSRRKLIPFPANRTDSILVLSLSLLPSRSEKREPRKRR